MNNNEVLKYISEVWEKKVKKEPYYSSVNDSKYLISNLNDENKKSFFDTGFRDVDFIKKTIEECKINLDISTCMEYGCGIGRVTSAFCKTFPCTYGIDISNSYLEIAKENLDSLSHLKYIKINKQKDIEDLPNVDLIYSVLVLQHNPPPISSIIIKQFCRCLNPNGIAIFQIPTYNYYYKFIEKDYISSIISADEIDMHVLSQKEIFDIILKNNCKIIEIKKDFWTGRLEDLSQTFVIQKESS